jgi:hypothetical protein
MNGDAHQSVINEFLVTLLVRGEIYIGVRDYSSLARHVSRPRFVGCVAQIHAPGFFLTNARNFEFTV